MIEKKFIENKKAELAIKEFIKKDLGKGKISNIKIERTPVGERIIIFTTRPALIIGRGGESIQELTETLRRQFKLENPKLEISEIMDPEFDAQNVADQLAIALERFGPMTFKIKAYRALERVKDAGALGAEIIMSGKLPGEKARTWMFHFGYMKKTGEINIVNSAQARAETIPGTVGIKVSIVPKNAQIPDKIEIKSPEIVEEIKEIPQNKEESGKVSETKEVSIKEEKSKDERKKKAGRKKKQENKKEKNGAEEKNKKEKEAES